MRQTTPEIVAQLKQYVEQLADTACDYEACLTSMNLTKEEIHELFLAYVIKKYEYEDEQSIGNEEGRNFLAGASTFKNGFPLRFQAPTLKEHAAKFAKQWQPFLITRYELKLLIHDMMIGSAKPDEASDKMVWGISMEEVERTMSGASYYKAVYGRNHNRD
jgi:hypothetical protein